ncbi:hypothetical protein O6H91_Y531200 [Diphasiastrum complanatum]|nr:hypothetical protein O6H91_Y531200 [Diphasiastrum complanatum]
MIEREDLSAPLIISPSFLNRDNNTDQHVDSANRKTVEDAVCLQAPFQMNVEDADSATLPLMPQSLSAPAEGSESLEEGLDSKRSDAAVPKLNERRKVQWVDGYGKAIAEVKEFERSDSGESDEEDGESQSCNCTIQ